MKSYGEEYYDNPNQRVIDDSTYMFIETLNSVEGENVYIDDISCKAYITNTSNPNTETKEERIISVLIEQPIKTGNYIKGYDDGIYLVISDVDNHISHKEAKIRKCNHEYKWMYKGAVHSAYGIGANQTKYTLGTSGLSIGITESDSRYSIDFPNDINCKTIKVGQRFIFNDGAWKVAQIDYISSKGLLSILLGQDSINENVDDIKGEIAGAFADKHTYIYDIPSNFEVVKDNVYNLVYSIKDETGKDFDYSLITVTTTNNNIVQIANNEGVISVKGLVIGIGSIKLSVPIGATSKDFIINFEVKDVVIDKIEYKTEVSNSTTLRLASSTNLTVKKYNNGIEIPCNIEFTLDNNGQSLLDQKKIDLQQKSNNIIWIKNVNVNGNNSFVIKISDKDTKTLINEQQILLKGV